MSAGTSRTGPDPDHQGAPSAAGRLALRSSAAGADSTAWGAYPRYGNPFTARHAAVAAPHELASVAGLNVLQQGGSAVDAMVAVNSTLGVVYPHMTGGGGDAFWLIHDAKTQRQYVLNASGRAAAAATRDNFSGGLVERGPRSALTAPGAVDGWVQSHERFGRLSMADCLAPAIDYARNGVPVGGSLARFSAECVDLLRATPETARVFLRPDGRPHARREILRNPWLADTMQAIVEGGHAAFYGGPIGREIGDYLARHGGVLTADDIAGHTSDWVEPASVSYRGRTALCPPPNSQGFAGLQILGMLEHFDVAALGDDPLGYIDLMVRATAVAFQDRDRYLTDPGHMAVSAEELLDPEYLAQRAELLRNPVPAHAILQPAVGGDTTFSCAVDAEGNAAAVIQSIYHEWGSGVVAGDTGLLLQNRGCFFSLDPAHPNSLEPGKRTAHTLTAGMLVGPQGLELVYGTMGGEGQPQTSATLATRVVDHGMSPQAAIDAPRWLLGRTWGEDHRGLRLEGRFGQEVADRLVERGHDNVSLVENYDQVMGHAQAIQVFSERLEAGSDPRSDGGAVGY